MTENEESYEHNSYKSIEWIDTGRRQYRATADTVKMWMRDHIIFNKEIRDLSDTLYNSKGLYSRVIDYIVALPTLDKVVYGSNVQSKRYATNKEKYKNSLSKMKDDTLTRDIIRKLSKSGTYFGYFISEELKSLKGSFSDYEIDAIAELNNNKINCGVISLPIDYCKIVGTENSSYVVAFDMQYFDQFRTNGLSQRLMRYPKEIREGYKKYNSSKSEKWLVLDNNKTVVLKARADIDERWGRPLGLGAFLDILFDQDYTEVKRDTIQRANGQVIYQTFPEGSKENKSVLSSTQQQKQHNDVRDAIFNRKNNSGINFFSIAAGTTLNELKIDLSILDKIKDDELIKKIATDLGFASSLLNGEESNYSSQKNNLDLISAEIFSWIAQIENEYNKVINENVIKDDKCEIKLSYLQTTHLNREGIKNNAKDLYTLGKGPLELWIAASGFNPDACFALMEEELIKGYDQKFPVHQTSFTQSTNDNKPTEDNPTNENTIKTKSNDANNNPSPKGGE
ncbi:hypothetical protein [Paenibacillus donghaensis]|uniref:Phage portal protein n=1 Tax=Paenibacillus donghaensis TaxID=414771 RepID=A0A2Z2KI09_9BACL|nr:hypothetical protein [Paenibacillus donghaensis]ASA21829.1 hypothetical protein B9T62_14225 [Paenibacillus donghaensis]